jgi:hypothetical protein
MIQFPQQWDILGIESDLALLCLFCISIWNELYLLHTILVNTVFRAKSHVNHSGYICKTCIYNYTYIYIILLCGFITTI